MLTIARRAEKLKESLIRVRTSCFLGMALGILLSLGAVTAHGSSVLRTRGRDFVDAAGGVVVLRGMNVAGNSKLPPFAPLRSMAELDPLQRWGMNVIRLLFTWEAYEPKPGVYDDAYLLQLAAIADGAWARGMYVIIDFHQDAFSRYVSGGCGEGFPAWATATTVTPQLPDNGPHCAEPLNILKSLLDPNSAESFAQFYSNSNGVRTRYLELFRRLAQLFRFHPGVIGYDLLNEPWGKESTEIAPLYEDVATVIRHEDPTAILFVEPHILSSSGFQTALPRPTFSNFAYAPHFYDTWVLAKNGWDGCPLFTEVGFQAMVDKAAEWNVPLFVGEFGAQATATNIAGYTDLQYQELNRHLLSAAQWNYTPLWNPLTKDGWNRQDLSVVDDKGNPRASFRIRPYAQRIAGTPTRLAVTQAQALFPNSVELDWIHAPAMGESVLFVPGADLFGATPVKIETSGAGLLCLFDAARTHVSCRSPQAGPMHVKIRPCMQLFGLCL